MGYPYEFYRVFDDSSQSRYDKKDGFVGGSCLELEMFRPWSEREEYNLIAALDSHLDWGN